jgi:uncharacterized protein (DUF305 family)
MQGIELAEMASEKAADPHLQALGRLMVATQKGDITIFDQWWKSWFGSLPEHAGHHHEMQGIVPEEEMEALRTAQGPEFDDMFIRIMSFHHAGAIAMSDEAMIQGGDPRIRILAHALRHAQSGEIELMKGTSGLAATGAAIRAMFGGPPELP